MVRRPSVARSKPHPQLTDAQPFVAMPERMDDASTSRLALGALATGDASAWLYYYRPVANYLRGLGCAAQDVDDLTHELLIKLRTSIGRGYDPERPFRPYLKIAIRNHYFQHLRERSPRSDPNAKVLAEQFANEADPAPAADALMLGLLDYAREVYDRFAREAEPRLAHSVAMLHAWLIDDRTQEQLSEHFKVSPRQIRTHLNRAADAIAVWMQSRINAEDFADLDAAARAGGASLDLQPDGLRELFSHLSKAKRVRVLLILMLLHRPGSGTPVLSPRA